MDRATLLLPLLTLPIIGMVVAVPASADTVVKLSVLEEPPSPELLARRTTPASENMSASENSSGSMLKVRSVASSRHAAAPAVERPSTENRWGRAPDRQEAIASVRMSLTVSPTNTPEIQDAPADEVPSDNQDLAHVSDRNTPAERRTEVSEAQPPTIRPPVTQPRPALVAPRPPSRRPRPPVAEPRQPVVLAPPPVIQPQAPIIQPQAPIIQPQAPVIQPQAPVIQPQAPIIQPQAPVIQPQGPVVQPQGPVVQPRAPVVRPRFSFVAPPPPTVQPRPPAAPPQQLVASRQRVAVAPRPMPKPPSWRSEQLERIAQEADRMIRHGFELAGRKACFAARAEFVKALRLIAQGLDTEHQTASHSRALAAALTAMEEVEDFTPEGSRLEGDLNLTDIVRGHRTPVLKRADTDDLTAMTAVQCYFAFAQEQLAAAVRNEVAGSMALHALGKLHGALAVGPSPDVRAAESKGVAFYRAALLARPDNHMAANDLGVLLASSGNYREAGEMLKRSLSVQPRATTWHNLATVHQRLGEFQLARQAENVSTHVRREETARRMPSSGGGNRQIQWVDEQTFSLAGREKGLAPQTTRTPRQPASNSNTSNQKTASARTPQTPANTSESPAATVKSVVEQWLPWTRPEKKRN